MKVYKSEVLLVNRFNLFDEQSPSGHLSRTLNLQLSVVAAIAITIRLINVFRSKSVPNHCSAQCCWGSTAHKDSQKIKASLPRP